MYLTTENVILIESMLLFISVLAGKTSYKFGVPTLLLFLVIGILAGNEGIGGIILAEKLRTIMIPDTRKVLNSNLLI